VNDVILTKSVSRVFVDAPDGPAALALEQRLVHLGPAVIAHGDRRSVKVEAVEDISELEASVKSWLREIGASEPFMHVEGRDVRGCAPRLEHRLHRSSNENFVG
jgi:hypothetical protein